MTTFTRTGDRGTTTIIGGKKVPKDDARIEACGTVDELNSHIGHLRSLLHDDDSTEYLLLIQQCIFDAQTLLAADKKREDDNKRLHRLEEMTESLEDEIERMELDLPELENFIVPGGSTSASWCHVVRCVCRRAERRIASLSLSIDTYRPLYAFVNRLSDYLFVKARHLSQQDGYTELYISIN